MTLQEFETQFTQFLKEEEPFFFLVDFEKENPFVCKMKEAHSEGVFFNIKGIKNYEEKKVSVIPKLSFLPIDKAIYTKSFEAVKEHLKRGNTYLLNLTFPTEIEMNASLEDVFHLSDAPYKLLFKNQFVLFSPESFVQIQERTISTFPMKGTIDAALKNASHVLLSNKKEEWEHNTIVDLMRNDLSMIATDIKVENYRYVERIKTHHSEILQTSSKISGRLKKDFRNTLCQDLLSLLPAGSVSGAPKQKTVEIIQANEITNRGYYTGIFGIYDGEKLDSAVNIRFIERDNGKTYFRSGGGITTNSVLEDEYNELLQKIYLPKG